MKSHFLVLSKIDVEKATAFSSPYSVGFPAVTAFLGFAHAIERKVQRVVDSFSVKGVGIICHKLDLQVYRSGSVNSIIGQAFPLLKNCKQASFIETPLCHGEFSVVLEFDGIDESRFEWIANFVSCLALSMRLAGGTVIKIDRCFFEPRELDVKKMQPFLAKLMPAYALIDRRDIMQGYMELGLDAGDALLDALAVTHRSSNDEKKIAWSASRAQNGWVVPISVGYLGISELGKYKNQRDEHTDHRFAEAIVSTGEFRMLHKFKNIDDLLWVYHVDDAKNLYTCRQKTIKTERAHG